MADNKKKENKSVEEGRWGTYSGMYSNVKLTDRQKSYIAELNKSLAKGGKNGKK